jgi:hypothetical protein
MRTDLVEVPPPLFEQNHREGRAACLRGGGSTGLASILIVIWSALRGWQRDEQRAPFQPTGVATFLITMIGLAGTGGEART